MSKLILLVGPPGSGKSTLAQQYVAEGYVYINQDTQGKEHLHNFDMAVVEGFPIVVDRMNFNRQQRSRYLEVAKDNGYETTIVVLHQPRKVCFDRMMVRENHPTIKDSSAANSALNTFFSKYERPLPGEADYINFIYPAGAKELAVIIDLDGTMCNVDHRLHHVRKPEGQKKNWKGFFEDLANDTPNEWCVAIHDMFGIKYPIVFASGRPDDHEKVTREWLKKHELGTQHLYMRCRGDHRQDYIAKEIILDFEILTRFTPLFFIDDRKQVVDLWRSRGFTCLQCAEGAF
jgi:predicted kinase